MFVIVSSYRAKVGEEDAIIALHEDWQRNRGKRTQSIFHGNSSGRPRLPAISSRSHISQARSWRRQQKPNSSVTHGMAAW